MCVAAKLYLLSFLLLLSASCVSAQVISSNSYITLGAFGEMGNNDYLGMLDIGKIYKVNRFINLGGEITIYKFSDKSYSSVGVGLRPVVNVSLLQRKDYQIFTEGRGGIVYMFPEYPRCAINFTFVWNTGLEFRATKQTKLRIGFAYHHYSNGKTYSEGTNAAWDGIGANIGVHYNFRNYK